MFILRRVFFMKSTTDLFIFVIITHRIGLKIFVFKREGPKRKN